jgi:hypothetical protein
MMKMTKVTKLETAITIKQKIGILWKSKYAPLNKVLSVATLPKKDQIKAAWALKAGKSQEAVAILMVLSL